MTVLETRVENLERKTSQLDNDIVEIYRTVNDIRGVQNGHTRMLIQHSDKLDKLDVRLDQHSEMLDKLDVRLDQHGEMLGKLDVRLDQHSEMLAAILEKLSN